MEETIRAHWPDRRGDGSGGFSEDPVARLAIGNTYEYVRPRAGATPRARRNVHLWTVFVEPRSPCPPIRKVEFWLWTKDSHVTLTRAPWAVRRVTAQNSIWLLVYLIPLLLRRKGWGTFAIRIRVTFRDAALRPYIGIQHGARARV